MLKHTNNGEDQGANPCTSTMIALEVS